MPDDFEQKRGKFFESYGIPHCSGCEFIKFENAGDGIGLMCQKNSEIDPQDRENCPMESSVMIDSPKPLSRV
jgi:hypothetical protein